MILLRKVLRFSGSYTHFTSIVNTPLKMGKIKYRPLLNFMYNLQTSAILNLSGKKKQEGLVNLASVVYETPTSDPTIPIVIMHGLLGSKNNWNSIAKALHARTKKRTVYAVDARNHGDSPHTDEFSYPIMVSDLVKFMRDKEVPKATLIGHSLGGRVCMLLALMYPQMVHNLVVVDISPVGDSPNLLELPKLFKLITELPLDPKINLSEARRQAAALLRDKMEEKFISFILTNLVEDEAKTSWRWKFNIDSISKNFVSEICKFPVMGESYNGDTLFVAGADSDYLRKTDEPEITTLFPQAKFTYIKGAGHWVHADQPQVFLETVLEFLNKDGDKGGIKN